MAKISFLFLGFFVVFFFLFFVFSHSVKNCYKTQTHNQITLKFGTHEGSPKANSRIKFGANLMNSSGVMTDYSRKQDRFVVTPTG